MPVAGEFYRTAEDNLNPRQTAGDFPGPSGPAGMFIPTGAVQNNLFAWWCFAVLELREKIARGAGLK